MIDFASDPNVAVIQAGFSDEFFETFDKGVQVRNHCCLDSRFGFACRVFSSFAGDIGTDIAFNDLVTLL